MSTSRDSLLEYRQQPLLELVHSEENYVQQLQLVRDTYMTVVNTQHFLTPTPSLLRSESCCSERSSTLSNLPSPASTLSPLQPIPTPPAELASRWRIIWGNWVQLTEWHSQFVEKLKRAVHEQPDDVPLLFLNSQSRLRSMYMKYCENYSKAVILVAPFKMYFEELRRAFFDKNDILSRLMQPIQRVTRYQLPMMEALKLTEQAGAEEAAIWRAAVIVLKNLPNDVQLMLEAARIVGFPGSVTNQGNLRLFEAMYVARTTQAELRSAQSVAIRIKAKNSGTHHSSSYSHSSAPHVFRCRAMTSPAFMRTNSGSGSGGAIGNDQKTSAECHHCRIRSKCCAAAQKSINLHFTECRVFLFDQCLIIAEDNNPSPSANTPSENTGVSNGFQANLGRVVYGSGSLFKRMGSYKFDLRPQRPLRLFTDDASHTPICGGRSPAVRRTVRIRRHGSHLSSLEFDSSGTLGGSGGNWPKLGWSTPHDPFRQSTYKFIHAVKVNRMAFTPDWLSPNMKHLDSPDMGSENPRDHSTTNKLQNSDISTMASMSIMSASTGHSHSEHSAQEDGKCFNKGKLGNCQVPDRFWFAIADKAPSSDAVFILDPFSEEAREAWLLEIADMAEMQAQLQIALQNPRQFCFANSMRRQAKTLSSMDMTALCTNWHGEERNAFFSAHSSTTQLVEAGVNVSVNAGGLIGKDDGRIHFRGVSAPQADWWKQASENHSLGNWAECDSPMERPRRLQFSTSASHDCSVPDIIQTPDDVFLPNVTAASEEMPQYQEGDSNHLQLPVENQRSRLRRRSLSQNDADSVNVRNSTISELSQLSREHAVHTCSKTPSCSLSSGQSFSTTAPTKNLLPMSADTTASNMQKKKIMAVISSRLRRSSRGFSEMLSKPASQSASTNRSPVNPTQVRRRLFRWSIVDKTSISENVNPALLPPRPPPSSSHLSDKSQESAPDEATANSPHKSKYLSMTPQLQRRKPPNKLSSVEAPNVKKPQSSIRMLSHLRLSFRLNSRNNSTANADINKPHISSVTPVVTHIRTSISSD